jgi:hypothetical protein
VFGKYAQVTNNPENDGCINAVLRALSYNLSIHVILTTDQSFNALDGIFLIYCNSKHYALRTRTLPAPATQKNKMIIIIRDCKTKLALTLETGPHLAVRSTIMSKSHSPSPAPTGTPDTRHARSAHEKQRQQLERLLKDPAKPAPIPAPPKEKAIRPAREMMKNVQGSSAGAGSGEFHVYKASRRREYERLKALNDGAEKVCFSTLGRVGWVS